MHGDYSPLCSCRYVAFTFQGRLAKAALAPPVCLYLTKAPDAVRPAIQNERPRSHSRL